MPEGGGSPPAEAPRPLPPRAKELIERLITCITDTNIRLADITRELNDLPQDDNRIVKEILDERGGLSILSLVVAPPWLLEGMGKRSFHSWASVSVGEQVTDHWAACLADADPRHLLAAALRLVRAAVRVHGPATLHDLIELAHEIGVEMVDQTRRMQAVGEALTRGLAEARLQAATEARAKAKPEEIN